MAGGRRGDGATSGPGFDLLGVNVGLKVGFSLESLLTALSGSSWREIFDDFEADRAASSGLRTNGSLVAEVFMFSG